MATVPETASSRNKRLVLCFDGTGNSYTGTSTDTNVVKLYQKFDKLSSDQLHYYQPGIGTYTIEPNSVNLKPFEKRREKMKETLDQAFGLLFDAHVMSGYQFIMRYYNPGDKIFIFGFSRGAFTARFLARMICAIGVLAKGNEEMTRFAYKKYQQSVNRAGKYKHMTKEEVQQDLNAFKETFCREHVLPYFLGLWDTVNSVAVFRLPGMHRASTENLQYDSVAETAVYVRHAVSIDERRCKFRPALLCPGATKGEQQMTDGEPTEQGLQEDVRMPSDAPPPIENVREVFFAGNHGDIGGGWPAKSRPEAQGTDYPLQLSDIALDWMLSELDAVNAAAQQEVEQIAFNDQKTQFQEYFRKHQEDALIAKLHDTLKFKGGEGSNVKNALFWKFLETLPIERLELIKPYWMTVRWPPSYGGTRDIPLSAEIHESVRARIDNPNCPPYQPKNEGLERLMQL